MSSPQGSPPGPPHKRLRTGSQEPESTDGQPQSTSGYSPPRPQYSPLLIGAESPSWQLEYPIAEVEIESSGSISKQPREEPGDYSPLELGDLQQIEAQPGDYSPLELDDLQLIEAQPQYQHSGSGFRTSRSRSRSSRGSPGSGSSSPGIGSISPGSGSSSHGIGSISPGSGSSSPGSIQIYPAFPPDVAQHYVNVGQTLNTYGLTVDNFEDAYNLAHQRYVLIERVGFGCYASVYRSLNYDQQTIVAIKVFRPTEEAQRLALMTELEIVDILIERPHNNLVMFYETFNSNDYNTHYIVSEFAPLGDMVSALSITNDNGQKVWEVQSPQTAKHLIRGVALGVQHLLSLGICHGDIKLDNILICLNVDNPTENDRKDWSKWVPKLTDFNNCERGQIGEPVWKNYPRCTIYNAAPESWHSTEHYDVRIADVYSVGVTLLSILLACHPFASRSPATSDELTFTCTQLKKDRTFLKQLVRPFEYRLKQVLLRLLEPEPQNRITIDQFLADDWITQMMPCQELEDDWTSTLWKGHPLQILERRRSH